MWFVLLGIAVLPSLIIAYLIYRYDKEKENHRHLWFAYLYGCISVIPILILEVSLGEGDAFFNAFVSAAFSEELFKFLFLMFFIYRRVYFNEPYDGIIYATFISLGFATIENIAYVLQHGLFVGILRMFLSVPGHAIFGVFMGYFVGIAKFQKKNKALYLFLGFFTAFLTHGFYDYFLFLDQYPLLAFLSIGIIIFGVVLARKAILIHRRRALV